MSIETAVALPERISSRLGALAARTGVSPSDHILKAIEGHLDRLQPASVEDRILDRIRCGENQAYKLKLVRRPAKN